MVFILITVQMVVVISFFKTDGDLRWEVVRKLRLVAIFYGSVWGNNWLSTWLHNHVVRDIRLGSMNIKTYGATTALAMRQVMF
ncbi:phage tail fiber protein [Escherichia coli]|nr:phage tail fiber protein [Escherichia coli]